MLIAGDGVSTSKAVASPGNGSAARAEQQRSSGGGNDRIVEKRGMSKVTEAAQAITGAREVSPERARDVVVRAIVGDATATGSRTTAKIRRDGSHVGARDARQGVIERDLAKLRAEAKDASPAARSKATKAIERLEDEQRTNRGLNAAADTLHVLGASAKRVKVVEDAKRVTVVDDATLSSSAAYDEESDTILVSRSVANQAARAAEALIEEGILDDRGRIVRGREDDLDRSAHGDVLIKVGHLISVHEQMHAEQHAAGALDEFEARTGRAIADEERRAQEQLENRRGGNGPKVDRSRSESAWAHEQSRIDHEEYDAYLAQEQADIALGASVQVQLVTGAGGAALDRAKGVENLVDLARGRALRHGGDRGWVRSDALAQIMNEAKIGARRIGSVPWDPATVAKNASVMLEETPGWKRPGWKRPGWKRPGWKRPGTLGE